MNNYELLKLSIKAALYAGTEILDFYNSSLIIQTKKDKTPLTQADINSNKIIPNYKEFKGWDDDITQIKNEDNLPDELISYINYIENFVKVPIKLISVGPDRNQTITRNRWG